MNYPFIIQNISTALIRQNGNFNLMYQVHATGGDRGHDPIEQKKTRPGWNNKLAN